MTYTTVKEKLHDYIDHADQKKVKAIFALIEDDRHEIDNIYTEEFLTELAKRSDEAFADLSNTLTVKQAMDSMKTHISK